MARGHRPPRVCPKCEAPVLWWRNANQGPDEKWLCVDLSSDEAGTVQKIVTTDRSDPHREQRIVWGRRLTGMDLAAAVGAGELLFTLHATTCSAHRPTNPKPEGLQIAWPNSPRRRA